jgi:hypothetical protein
MNYDKQANKSWRHIEFEVRDLVWNTQKFGIRFVPKYANPYKVICKLYLNVYIL